jgi:DNA-binding response OmpR family regulator
MAIRLNRESGVEREVQKPGSFGLPFFGGHYPKGTGPFGLAAGQPRRELGARRILFIEDDRFIAEMYRIRLEDDGWNVELAFDGETGVRQALASPPDLILLDILLPRLDGIEVLRRLRAAVTTRGVPVLVISNAAGLSGREGEARELGIVDWIVKANTTPARLADRVSRILSD